MAYSMLVLGDSVMWGQGLPGGQKMHTIVPQYTREEAGAGAVPAAQTRAL